VTEAARQLRQAGERLQQAGPPGTAQPGNSDGEPGQPGEGSEGTAGEGNSGAPMDSQGPMNGDAQSGAAQPGEQGQSQGQPQSAAEALQQAAAALQNAAGQLQPSGMRSQQPGAPGSAGQAPPSAGAGMSQDSSRSGGGTRQPVSLVDLETQLKELSTRNWGELPGTLRTELQNTSRKRPDGDYARLIKLYFEEISRRQAPTLEQPAAAE
jgi:hypothetical protein